jgi:hypothetical protein|tara:strand:- start:196 stop:300 length:105 start_codon:yes stop_codon:yes gene_type:complete
MHAQTYASKKDKLEYHWPKKALLILKPLFFAGNN